MSPEEPNDELMKVKGERGQALQSYIREVTSFAHCVHDSSCLLHVLSSLPLLVTRRSFISGAGTWGDL